MDMLGWIKNLDLGWIFDAAVCRTSSSVFRVDRYFDFIVASAASSSCHSYVVQSGRIIFRATSEFVGNSLPIPSQIFIRF